MKLISLTFALSLSFLQLGKAAESSSRTFDLQSDTAVSQLVFGLYKLGTELRAKVPSGGMLHPIECSQPLIARIG